MEGTGKRLDDTCVDCVWNNRSSYDLYGLLELGTRMVLDCGCGVMLGVLGAIICIIGLVAFILRVVG